MDINVNYKEVTSLFKYLYYRFKYPIVLQYDRNDCGAISLLSILRYWGGNTSIVKLRELCNTTVDGSTMLDIVKAAEQLGFDAKGVRGEFCDLEKKLKPCIAHVIKDKLQHYIVIFKISKNSLLVSDFEKGLSKISKQDFLKIWETKSAVLLKPKIDLINEKTIKFFCWIKKYLKKEESWIYQTIFLGVLYTITGLLTSVIIKLIIDEFIPGNEYHKIMITGIFLLLLLTFKSLAGYLRNRFFININKRISININRDFISHLFCLPKKFFDTRKVGDIKSRINDIARIQQIVLKISGATVIDLLVVLGSAAMMFYFSTTLGWIAITTLPIHGILLAIHSKRIKNEQLDVMKSSAQVESAYFDTISGVDEIYNYNSASFFSNVNIFFFRDLHKKIEKLGLTKSFLGLISEFTGIIISIGLLTIGALLVINDRILLGEMMASYSLLSYIFPAINSLVDANISWQGAQLATQRLMDISLVPTEANDGMLPFKFKEVLEVKNGSFSWNRRRSLLENINIELKKGRITSLVGNNGSGKSTLVQILQRKYSLQEGSLYVDGIDANMIDLQEYRKGIGVVPQNIKVFTGTLLDNILVGRKIDSVDEIKKKLNKMGLESFYSKFESHLGTMVGEDNRKLSGGEKQVVALTRALWDEPDVLIVDEGFNGLDTELELIVHKLLIKHSKNGSVLLITHNRDIILNTDFVYILENGEIIQSGEPRKISLERSPFKGNNDNHDKNMRRVALANG